jgi:FkbM family methyltransferase
MIRGCISELSRRIDRRRSTVRFFARKALSRLPYVAVPLRLRVAPEAVLNLWWSYIGETDVPGVPLTEWSADLTELQFLWSFLRPGMSFFDVGSYHGIYSIVASKKLGAHAHVVAFEPSPRERRRVMLHALMNGVCIAIEPYAITSEPQRCQLFIASGFISMNSLVPPPIDAPLLQTEVQGISLDRYVEIKAINQIDLLKIDIEGAELEAFRGARRILESIRPLIVCEVLDWVTRPWNYPASKIIAFLSRLDYQWFDFREDGTLVPHITRTEYPETRNYLAVPREKRLQIRPWLRT